jgi:hypothetical protein
MIGVDGAQVLAMFARTRISWPPAVQTLLRVMSALNLNIELVAPECIIPDVTVTLKFYVSIGLPVAVGALFLIIFAAKYFYKRCFTSQRKQQLVSHLPPLVSALIVLSRVLYLFATRAALEPLNCVPTDPPEPNGFEYMSGLVDIPCWQEGSVQVALLPMGIIALGLYTVACPVLLAMFLRRNRESIKHDQILRAAGCGDDRLSNPKLYDFRRMWSQAYYMFKPGKASYWLLIIFARKLGISVAALMFRTTPSYQLAIALLVLFAAYVLQTKHQPFMSRRDQAIVLAEHRAKVLHDMAHARIEAEIQETAHSNARMARKTPALFDRDTDGRRPKLGRSEQSRGRAGALAVVRMADYNAAEATLLAVAVCVCLSGLMFASDRFSASRIDLYRAEYEGLAYVVVALVSFAVLYFLAVLLIDISFSFNPLGTAACIERTCSVCIGRCTAVAKGQSSKRVAKRGAGSVVTSDEADSAASSMVPPKDGGAAAAAMKLTSNEASFSTNPMHGVSAEAGTRADSTSSSLLSELASLTSPPSSEMWPAVKQWMMATAKQADQLKERLSEAQQRALADSPTSSGSGEGFGVDLVRAGGSRKSASRRSIFAAAPQKARGKPGAAEFGKKTKMAKLATRKASAGRRTTLNALSRPHTAVVDGSELKTATESPLRGTSTPAVTEP